MSIGKKYLHFKQARKTSPITMLIKLIKLYRSFFRNELQTIQQAIKFEVMHIMTHYRMKYANNISDALENDVASCSAVLQDKMEQVTGNYIVRTPGGLLWSVYCDMTRTCGEITGG